VITGAAILPTTPLLIPGLSPAAPTVLARVARTVPAAIAALPAADVTILLTTARPGEPTGILTSGIADLTPIGHPARVLTAKQDLALATTLSHATGLPLDDHRLSLGPAVLVHLLGADRPVVGVAVVPGEGQRLVALGEAIAGALEGLTAVLVAAGDLAAGLTDKAPLALVKGAREWDERVVDAVASGRLDGIPRMGPEEALRVGALGWAPLCVLHGALARQRLGLVVRAYAAPRGVGYLVAAGA
jgi:hypothetical protein